MEEPTQPVQTHTPEGKMIGTVKWFNSAKGFGFVTPNDGTQDIFVHQSSIYSDGFRSLGEGEDVEFSIETDETGKSKAVDVTGPNGGFVQGAPKRDNRRRMGRGGRGGRGGRPGKEMRGQEGEPGQEDSALTSSGLQVVVHNLSWSTDWRALKDTFATCGNVARADVAADQSGRSRGFGTVRYETVDEANIAINTFNNTEMDGRTITVRLDRFA